MSMSSHFSTIFYVYYRFIHIKGVRHESEDTLRMNEIETVLLFFNDRDNFNDHLVQKCASFNQEEECVQTTLNILRVTTSVLI